MPPSEGRSLVALPSTPEAPVVARRHVRNVLAGLDAVFVADVELAASELVSNAVLHAGAPGHMRVHVLDDGSVRIEVDDNSAVRPVLCPTPSELGGRGLRVIELLTSSWGVDSNGAGKVVWFEMAPPA